MVTELRGTLDPGGARRGHVVIRVSSILLLEKTEQSIIFLHYIPVQGILLFNNIFK